MPGKNVSELSKNFFETGCRGAAGFVDSAISKMISLYAFLVLPFSLSVC